MCADVRTCLITAGGISQAVKCMELPRKALEPAMARQPVSPAVDGPAVELRRERGER
eukprot:COSAG04_NODE_11422_length_710_cov_0.628478_1_plen_56_part_10